MSTADVHQRSPYSRADLERLAASLESLRQELRDDLLNVRRLPESQIAQVLRERSTMSMARSLELQKRLLELREDIDAQRRTLERLRAWMHQIRGGARPH